MLLQHSLYVYKTLVQGQVPQAVHDKIDFINDIHYLALYVCVAYSVERVKGINVCDILIE